MIQTTKGGSPHEQRKQRKKRYMHRLPPYVVRLMRLLESTAFREASDLRFLYQIEGEQVRQLS